MALLTRVRRATLTEALVEGQTLLLPAGALSTRDKEILAGIGPWTYRTYPVRAGENISVRSLPLQPPTCPSSALLDANGQSSEATKYGR